MKQDGDLEASTGHRRIVELVGLDRNWSDKQQRGAGSHFSEDVGAFDGAV